MATLSSSELDTIRQQCASRVAVNYTKTQINAAAQAIETWLVGQAAAISVAIDAATAPLVLTAAQKKKLVAETLRAKFERDR